MDKVEPKYTFGETLYSVQQETLYNENVVIIKIITVESISKGKHTKSLFSYNGDFAEDELSDDPSEIGYKVLDLLNTPPAQEGGEKE